MLSLRCDPVYLRATTFIIGICNMVASFLVTMFVAIFLVAVIFDIDDINDRLGTRMIPLLMMVLSISLIFFVSDLLISAGLVYGLRKCKPEYLFYYVLFSIVFYLLAASGIYIFTCGVVLTVLSATISSVVLVVVWLTYCQMKEEYTKNINSQA